MQQSSINNYFFILGNHPALSAAEILAYLNLRNIDFTIKVASNDCLIISSSSQFSADILQFIGGTVKFGKIKKSLSKFPNAKDIIEFLPPSTKIFFGFSFYPQNHQKLKKRFKSDVFHLGLALKKELKDKSIIGRLVTSRQENLSAVVVSKNKLLSDNGAEIIIIHHNNYFLGKTLAVQPFTELSERDYGRPQRDDFSGMLPPKLAQIMLNLSNTHNNDLLLDPFCGSATILQEALWQKRKNLIGSDISDKAIRDSQENLIWLKQKYNLPINNIKLFNVAVLELVKLIRPCSVDAIVTEPDLGQPDININNLTVEVLRLKKLYLQSYQVFFNLLKAGGKVVMVWPVFFGNNFLDIEDAVAKIGFKKITPLPQELINIFPLNKRNNLQYARRGQRISREITIWQKI